jgi:hypothetical protein
VAALAGLNARLPGAAEDKILRKELADLKIARIEATIWVRSTDSGLHGRATAAA